MAAKLKEASIGGTVNLEGYENLRFDFTAEIETPNDYMDLVAFAAGCLIGQARASKDPTGLVQEKLLGYVVRVTGVTEDQLPTAGKDQPKDITPATIDTATANIPPKPRAPAKVTDGPSHGMETKTADAEHQTMQAKGNGTPKENGKKVDPGPVVATCSKCPAGVTAGQKKISELFTGKCLCKTCLDEAQGVKA